MHIAVGADHAGYWLKGEILKLLEELGHSYQDFGTHHSAPTDYPDFAQPVAKAVAEGKFERGILICGNGVGVCIMANKVKGIRAALCHDTFCARTSREDDDTNVLCLGARIVGVGLAKDMVRVWLATPFSEAERHRRRIAKVMALEERGDE